jgi:uncharacterized membrane protein
MQLRDAESAMLVEFTQWAALALEFAASILIALQVLRTAIIVLQRQNITNARLHLAEGVVQALSLLTAGALLKTIGLFTWHQIGMFACILAIRTTLKQLFGWEARHLSTT